MRILIFGLATLATYATLHWVAPKYGRDVADRFLERSNTIPSSNKPLTEANLKDWVENKANSANVAGYVFPVLLPLDLFFLIALGGFMGFASLALSQQVPGLSPIAWWIWWVSPALYMIFDVAEDLTIASLLSKPELLSSTSFGVLSWLTFIKIAVVWFALIQFLGLGVLALGHFILSAVRS